MPKTKNNTKPFTFDKLVNYLRAVIKDFPDKRTGKNCRYTMQDAALGAFAVFFTQSPSFLAFQKAMHKRLGKSNAQSLFGMDKIPSDNHIRTLLDPVHPSLVFPVFYHVFDGLHDTGHLDMFRFFNNFLITLDATQHFSSQAIHCENCSHKQRDDKLIYSHSAITPVVVAPGNNKAIALPPEFITPQDGHSKQDCENAAAKRWLIQHGPHYKGLNITILGDDLYCKQPVCNVILTQGFNFILVCKPDSHKTLYQWVDELQALGALETVVIKRWTGKGYEIDTYRFVNQVPLRDGQDALDVNWCEITTRLEDDMIVYKNAFATSHQITKNNVKDIVTAGRTHWKIENENNNTLKTKGYHFEHNFGHGKKYLSSLFATFILLAFLFHTVLEILDEKYHLIRDTLPSRKTFFDDIRALTRYICFRNWEHLLNFMIRGLELEPP